MQRHNEVQALADALAVPYLDLNLNTEELGIDWNLDTLDGGDHLNYTGCQKATAYLQRYMQTHYTLPDRRMMYGTRRGTSRRKNLKNCFHNLKEILNDCLVLS